MLKLNLKKESHCQILVKMWNIGKGRVCFCLFSKTVRPFRLLLKLLTDIFFGKLDYFWRPLMGVEDILKFLGSENEENMKIVNTPLSKLKKMFS